MSYSRWGPSPWYAFATAGPDGTDLALWHCDSNNHRQWPREDIKRADAAWLRGRFPDISGGDIDEALEIIAEFLDDTKEAAQ